MKCVVKIIAAADGRRTPHDGLYVRAWNPHSEAGVLELSSTAFIECARRFDIEEAHTEWRTISAVQPRRPWDGEVNRPLCAVTVEIIKLDD